MKSRKVKDSRGVEHLSVSQAARDLGITTGSIFNCLAGKTVKAGKLKWKYNDQS
jgi:hypothetical protein